MQEIRLALVNVNDPRREHCWIADKDGEVAGSVLLVRSTDSVAKLRLLYVEPSARGHGIGDRLIGWAESRLPNGA